MRLSKFIITQEINRQKRRINSLEVIVKGIDSKDKSQDTKCIIGDLVHAKKMLSELEADLKKL